MKPQIKFSHEYFKIMGINKKAILLNIFRTHYNKLNKEFIQYDTSYEITSWKEHYNGKNGIAYYQLPKTDLLCLIFFSKNGELFTTLRRWTKEKEEYYRKMIGRWFEVVIE